MSIITHIKDNTKHIVIKGDLKSDEEQLLYEEALRDECSGLEVDFHETKFLSARVINLLATLRSRYDYNDLKIYTFNKSLSSYLSLLRIKNTLLGERRDRPGKKATKIRIVAMGGSAGSLEKIIEVLDNLPLLDITIFIVQHLMEGHECTLDKLLQAHTPYTVLFASPDTLIKSKTIYVAPPGFHTIVVGDYIYLTREQKVNYSRPSIDVLFKSLATEYGDEFLALLFCGYGRDGSLFLPLLKEMDSMVIVEDPDECEADSIPLNAVQSECFDNIKTSGEMVPFIESLLKEEPNQLLSSLDDFLADVENKYGYDFRDYKRDSVERCIRKAMSYENSDSFGDYASKVINEKHFFERLFLELSINTTTFFRTPDTFSMLRHEILPYLNTFPHIKIWCAGCSTGEEPYSFAILLKELGLLEKSRIYATDFNDVVLKRAINGLYPFDFFNIHENNYLGSGGTNDFSSYFVSNEMYLKIDDSLKGKILFFNHNLVSDGMFNEFQLIVCRNVLIYFDSALQSNVLGLFNESLDMSGFLVLGESENISPVGKENFFFPYNSKNRIYKKIPI